MIDLDPAMASTGLDHPTVPSVPSIHHNEKDEKHPANETPIAYGVNDQARATSFNSDDSNKPLFDSTHRKLKPRHIQLIGIGGYVEMRIQLRGGRILNIVRAA